MTQDSLKTILAINVFGFLWDFIVINLLEIGPNNFLLSSFFIVFIEGCSHIFKLIDVLFPWKKSPLDLEVDNFAQMYGYECWYAEIVTSFAFIEPDDWLVGDFIGKFFQGENSFVQKYDISLVNLVQNDLFNRLFSNNFPNWLPSNFFLKSPVFLYATSSSHRKHVPADNSPWAILFSFSMNVSWYLDCIAQVWVIAKSFPN